MKKFLLFLAAFAVALSFSGCSEDDKDDNGNSGGGNGGGNSGSGTTEETIKVSLSVTGLADNQATINVSLTEGNFYGAMLVEAVDSSTIDIDYTNEIRLISFVRENGVDIELPYTNTLTGLRADDVMFTAVIVFDSEGLATTSAYQFWTVVGEVEWWGEDSSAGHLDEDEW